MRVCVLHNRDHECLAEDPGREARAEVVQVASALAGALESCDFEVEVLSAGSDLIGFVDVLRSRRPAVVVNLCESLGGDSRGEMAAPALLEVLGFPYSGSSPLALGLALHKHVAKQILASRGIPTPAYRLIERADPLPELDLPFPVIVKPCREDASVGVTFDSVVYDRRQLGSAVRHVIDELRQPALVEQYVEGREIYVPLLGNSPRRALPLTEIRFGPSYADRPKIVTYRGKWDVASEEYQDSPAVPCELPKGIAARVVETAEAAFAALSCRDYGRVDVRLSPTGEPWVIDINPNCDLHPTAGFAKAAAAAGTGYPQLARSLVEMALERSHGDTPDRAAGSREPRRAARSDRNLLAGRGGLRAGAHRRRAQAE